VFAQATGKTISNVINDGRRELFIQRSASIIKDATGVALIMEKIGRNIASNGGNAVVRTAKKIPAPIPTVIPTIMRARDVNAIM
jgi:hypothetical protein